MREGTLAGAGGVEIYWRAWEPGGARRATVVLAHGASEHCGRYAHVAAGLNARGYAVWALDHRGHGRSGGDRAVIDRLDNALADLDELVTLASAELGAHKPFLLGHSMGGLLATAYTIRHQERLAGLILSAPAVALETVSPAQRLVSRILSRLTPRLGVYPIDSAGVSRDPEVVRDYDEDPLNHHGKLPVRTVAELVSEAETFPARARAVKLPVLIMHGGADPIVPVSASRMLDATFAAEDKTLTVYDGLYHEILNEPERDEVIAEICGWLDART